jgi:hypothetical protein
MPPLALKFLTTDADLTELARLYWELDQEEKLFPNHVKELASRFSLPANKVLKTVLENCEASSPTIVCEACGRARQYNSRNDYLEAQRHYRSYGNWKCSDCYRVEERRRQEEERKQRELAEQQVLALKRHYKELIEQAYARQEPMDYLLPTELSLTTAVYLLGCIKAGNPVCPPDASEVDSEEEDGPDFSLPRIIRNISPTKELDEEILERLKARGLVAISPASEPEAFDFEGDLIVDYDPEKVLWEVLPNVPDHERRSFITEVDSRVRHREYTAWRDEWPSLWKKIAAAECVEFLVCALERYNYSYTPDLQATELFGNLVDNYSVAQVFKLTDKAIKDVVDFARRQRWPMRPSRVVEKIRSNEAYYRSQGWNIFSFERRPIYPPQSGLSRLFFDFVLGIGDDGFFKAPRDVNPSSLGRD